MVIRNTRAWVMQVWVTFGLAVLSAGSGVWEISSNGTAGSAFGIAFLFSLFSTFALAKTLRDNQFSRVDTNAWQMLAWAAFVGSALGVLYELWNTKLTAMEWRYLLVSWFFLTASGFTLAKTLRDEQDADRIEGKNPMAEGQPPVEPASY